MKIFQVYKLKFKSGFHVDDYGNQSYSQSQDFIHSDTLSSALLSIWALREPEKIGETAKSPPYLLSSAFPYYKETFFLPVPKERRLLKEGAPESFVKKSGLANPAESAAAPKASRKKASHQIEDEFALKKKLKRVQFLPAGLWGKLLSDPECFLIPGQAGKYSRGPSGFQKNPPEQNSRGLNKQKPEKEQSESEHCFEEKKSSEMIFQLSKTSDLNERYKISSSFLIPENLLDSALSSSEKLKCSEEENPARREKTQRVAVSRSDNQAGEGQLFTFSRVHYRTERGSLKRPQGSHGESAADDSKGAGLWFFAQFSGEEERSAFEATLAILGDTGIGSDKNSGNGLFAFSKSDLSLFPFLMSDSESSAALTVKGADKPANRAKAEAAPLNGASVTSGKFKTETASKGESPKPPARFCLLSLFCPGGEEQKDPAG